MNGVPKNIWILIFLIIIGGIFGTLIGQSLGKDLPFLNFSQSLGLEPATINLVVITVTFGATLKLNISAILGIFIAFFIYSRL